MHNKLYVIVRADLDPGYQMAQAIHGAIQFQVEHPEIAREWFQLSNYLAVLNCKDEAELLKLESRAETLGLRFSLFFESDLGYQLTAMALEPGKASKKLCQGLPLALKDCVKM